MPTASDVPFTVMNGFLSVSRVEIFPYTGRSFSTFKDISVPVGRVQFLQLHPLSFAEYLLATGKDEAAAIVLGAPKVVPQAVHEFLCEELRRFFFVGGMPESVTAYAESRSLQESFEVQAGICDTYRADFAKYSPQADKHCLNSVLTTVARSVGKQIKYARLADGYANPTNNCRT